MDKKGSTKRGHLSYFLRDAKIRAKKKNLDFNITLDYLESITTPYCPIFGTPLIFGLSGKGISPTSPSLDRIIPDKGYVIGNVCFISHRANTIKHNVSDPNDLEKVANWLRSKIQ